MSRLLVTGADGFVGRYLVRAALAEGWEVTAAIVPGGAEPATWLDAGLQLAGRHPPRRPARR